MGTAHAFAAGGLWGHPHPRFVTGSVPCSPEPQSRWHVALAAATTPLGVSPTCRALRSPAARTRHGAQTETEGIAAAGKMKRENLVLQTHFSGRRGLQMEAVEFSSHRVSIFKGEVPLV